MWLLRCRCAGLAYALFFLSHFLYGLPATFRSSS
jgi:hypothetical protein